MKAVIYHGIGKISVEEMPKPTPGPTDVIIKNAVCGICGTDQHGYFTEAGAVAYYDGAPIGHEFAGTVVEVGSEVKGIPLGTRVAIVTITGKARTMRELGPRGRTQPLYLGGYSEYSLIEEAALGFNLFDLGDLDFDDGALCEIYATGLHGVHAAEIKAGDKVLILGAGPAGLASLASVLALGVEEVIVSDISDFRLAKAMELGASAVHNAIKQPIKEFTTERYGPQAHPLLGPIDAIVDAAGVSKATAAAIPLLGVGGRVAIVGVHTEATPIELGPLLSKNATIRGSMAYIPANYAELLDFRKAGKGDLRPMITHRFPIDEIEAAFNMTQKPDEAIKVVIDHSL